MLKNLGIAAGVVGGLLLAIWFSSVVAMGPAPGQGQTHKESAQTPAKKGDAAGHSPLRKDQAPAAKHEPDCEKSEKRDDCFLQWRAATAAEEQAKAAKDQIWYTWFGLWVLFITLGFTALAAVAAAVQAWLSRLGLVHTQRAFVFLKEFEAFPFPDRPLIKVMPKWENSGQTPTRRMVNHVNWRFFEGDIPSDYDFPDTQGEATVPVLIGPGGTVFTTSLDISASLLERAARREGRIYLWGWTDYDDVFENTPRHRTEFCYEMVVLQLASAGNVSSGNAPRQTAIQFRVHGRYNGADNECMKKAAPYPF